MRIAIIGQAAFGAAVYERLRADGHEMAGVFTPPETGRPDPLASAARGARRAAGPGPALAAQGRRR